MSSYKTIAGEAEAEIVEKKSRFIAHLAHVSDEDAALEFLARIRKEHAQARHNVYAYILRGGRVRYSDDGEPAQTSGLPTYETLEHAGLTDVICVTTRYFGGTLLGTGGLVRAYTDACKAAIDAADVVTVSRCVDVTVKVSYDMYQKLLGIADEPDVRIVSTDFAEDVTMVVRTLAENADALQQTITERTNARCEMQAGAPFDGTL